MSVWRGGKWIFIQMPVPFDTCALRILSCASLLMTIKWQKFKWRRTTRKSFGFGQTKQLYAKQTKNCPSNRIMHVKYETKRKECKRNHCHCAWSIKWSVFAKRNAFQATHLLTTKQQQQRIFFFLIGYSDDLHQFESVSPSNSIRLDQMLYIELTLTIWHDLKQ